MNRNVPARLLLVSLAGLIALPALGLGAAAVAYDRSARVPGDCDARFGDNAPTAWTVRGIGSAALDLDASPWFVADYREVRIPSRDPALELRAWWMPSKDGLDAPSIIVVHGFGTCVRDPAVLAPAGMLHRLGYGVLLLDLRDHGGSSVEDGRAAAGTEEYRDVLGAVDWLVDQGAVPGRIGLLGTSMGGATSIIAAGADQRIAAVWSDSSYADVMTRIEEGLEEHGLPRSLAPLARMAARLVSGDDIGTPSVPDSLAALGGRHLFVVHGGLDGLIDPSHADVLAAAARSAGVLVERWSVHDVGHVDAMLVHPAEYERRLEAFFGPAFAAGLPPSVALGDPGSHVS